jgi:hypothetical protein
MRIILGLLAGIKAMITAGRVGAFGGRVFRSWKRGDFERAHERAMAFLEFTKKPSPKWLVASLPTAASLAGQTAERTGRTEIAVMVSTLGLECIADLRQYVAEAKAREIGAKAEKDSLLDALSDPENAADFGRFEVEFKDRVDRLRNHATDRAPAEGPLPLDSF